MKKFVGDSEVLFATLADMAIAPEQAMLKIYSGAEPFVFAFHPLHAKRLMILMQEYIKLYEEKLGELKTDLQRPIPSPIQLDKKN